ncbi:alpha/beta fold hydrolase [Pendulispora albinea]|uniref:Alpha/beta hydrolase n=1 Tax=Pendulispora albinea TaxID=2741071 RepID=A0ABZ2LSR7_9BACT
MTHASDLHVERIGSGPPLLLIHGIGSRAGVWKPVVARLAREREVFAIDLPGFASSPPLPAGTSSNVHTLTDAVEAWIRKTGLDRPRVAGNSLGGAISLELARRNAVHSAAALSPAGFWIPIERKYAQSVLRSARSIGRRVRPFAPRLARSRTLRSLLAGPFFARPSRLDVDDVLLDLTALLDAPAFDETLDSAQLYRFARGEEIHVPVTIAWGTRDLLLLPQQAWRAKRLLPNARHVPLHGCGHVPMADDPEAVANVLLLH